MVSSIGFFARPLGVLFFGHIGDKIGRRASLICSITFMVIPTFGIGLIPSYASIGILAPILLALLRLIQGAATGGEFSGTMTYLYEIAPVKRRFFTGSFTFAAPQLGSVLCTAEYLFVNRIVSPETLVSWGWRVSFLLAAIFGSLIWFLRRTIHETPLFATIKTEGKSSKQPIFESFREHKLEMLQAFGITSLSAAGWSMIFVFSPIYFTTALGLNAHQQLAINAALLFYSGITMPFFGYLADRCSHRQLYFISAIGIFLLCLPLYFSAEHFSLAAFIVIELFMVTFLTIQFALLPTILCELFPLRVRYSCVGISYNLCIILFGAVSPLFVLYLTRHMSHLLTPAFIIMATAVISLWTYITVRPKNESETMLK